MIAAAPSCSSASSSRRCASSSAAICRWATCLCRRDRPDPVSAVVLKYGVDYDGNGHVDLRHSVPDVLASTANLLKVNGWGAGAPFGEGTRISR
jgi:hypothetical protein